MLIKYNKLLDLPHKVRVKGRVWIRVRDRLGSGVRLGVGLGLGVGN